MKRLLGVFFIIMSFLRGGDVFAEYNTPETARDLGDIEGLVSVNGMRLTAAEPAQYFKFNFSERSGLNLVAISSNAKFNSKVELVKIIDSKEVLINSDDNSGPGLDAHLITTISIGEPYYVKVSAMSPGQLSLDDSYYVVSVVRSGLEERDDNKFETAILYTPTRQREEGNITQGDNDYYSYYVAQRAMVEMKVKGSALTTGTLYDSNRVKIAQNSHSRESRGITRVATILEPGTYYFRVRGFTSAAQGPYELTISESPPVCATGALVPSHDTTRYEWIEEIAVEGPLQYASYHNGNNGGFKSVTRSTPSLELPLGDTSITLKPGFYEGSSYPENWAVWIDTNKDHVFDDSERIYSGQSTETMKTINAEVNIPHFEGETIMRVAMRYGVTPVTPSACGHVPRGEVEDYWVKIK